MSLNLPSHEIEDLRIAAALHDVGKIELPDVVLRKPSDLTAEEQELVRRHPDIGADMVAAASAPVVSEAIRHHHESWDGTGYPSQLQGEEIPLYARIVCVADAFDAMTSARPYRVGMSRRQAVDALRAGAGTQFDPKVVDAFIDGLPAGLQAAGAFLIFAVPAQGLRRIAAWSKAAGGSGLATAAGSTAIAVMIGGAALQPVSPQQPIPAVPAQALASEEEPVKVTISDRESRAEVLGKQLRNRKKASTSSRKRKGSRPVGAKAPSVDIKPNRNSGPDLDPGPKPNADPGKDKVKGSVLGDPQPHKGNDCASDRKPSNGHRKHCG